MGVCKKIKRRADQERNVWELFRMFKNEKKILGLSESTLQNYEDSLKRFMDYMECRYSHTSDTGSSFWLILTHPT